MNVPALAKPFFTRTVLMDHTLLLPLKPGCTSVEDANSKLSDIFDGVDIRVEETKKNTMHWSLQAVLSAWADASGLSA